MGLPPFVRTAAELRGQLRLLPRPAHRRRAVPEPAPGAAGHPQHQRPVARRGRASPGAINLPVVGEMGPAKVEHAIRSTTGGVGTQVLGATDAVARAFGLPASEERPPGVVDVPVVGGLAGTVLRNQGGQTERDAYRTLDRAPSRPRCGSSSAPVQEHPSYQAPTPAERADAGAAHRRPGGARPTTSATRPSPRGGLPRCWTCSGSSPGDERDARQPPAEGDQRRRAPRGRAPRSRPSGREPPGAESPAAPARCRRRPPSHHPSPMHVPDAVRPHVRLRLARPSIRGGTVRGIGR